MAIIATAKRVLDAPSISSGPDADGARSAQRRQRPRLPALDWKRWAVRALAVAAAILVWQVAARQSLQFYLDFSLIPTPLAVWDKFVHLLGNKTFYIHILVSLRRIGIAYVLACVSGVLLGVLMARVRLIEDIFGPYIELVRPIPAVAWIPLAIVMLPTEEGSIVFITYLGAFFPVVLNTIHGVQQTPLVLVRAARSLGAGRWSILWHVVLPNALPAILAGMSISMGVAWFSLLAAEIISGQYGIGYFTWAAYTLVQYKEIIVGMLIIGLLGTGCTAATRLAARPLLRWQKTH